MSSGDPAKSPDVVHRDPLVDLVENYLFDRTQHLSGPQTAAFLEGWTSALELVQRTDLTLPGAPDAILQAIASLTGRISAAQIAALEDSDDPGAPRR